MRLPCGHRTGKSSSSTTRRSTLSEITCSQRHASMCTSSQGSLITPTSRHSASRCLRMTRVASVRPSSLSESCRSPWTCTRPSRSILATVWLTVGPVCPSRSAIRARSGVTPSSSSSKMVRRYISVVSMSPCAVNFSTLLLVMLCRSEDCLGRKPFDGPAVAVAVVAQPVVQPVAARLPELHRVRDQYVPAPEVRHRDLRRLRPALLELGHPALQFGAGRDDLRLPAGPGAELRPAGPGPVVRLAVGLGQHAHRALGGHLAAQGVPGEDRAR